MVRASPIMEILTGIMIAGLIFYSGKLIVKNELDISSFFFFSSCNDVGLSTSKIISHIKHGNKPRISGG